MKWQSLSNLSPTVTLTLFNASINPDSVCHFVQYEARNIIMYEQLALTMLTNFKCPFELRLSFTAVRPKLKPSSSIHIISRLGAEHFRYAVYSKNKSNWTLPTIRILKSRKRSIQNIPILLQNIMNDGSRYIIPETECPGANAMYVNEFRTIIRRLNVLRKFRTVMDRFNLE